MARLLRAAVLIAFVFSAKGAFGACHAVGPAATGSGSGADWNNMMAVPSGSSWIRGDIYYLADGNYGGRLSISTPANGTLVIELRKAQSYDNCTSTGWNTATMGSGQAVWQWAGSGNMVSFGSSGYITFNGNGNVPANEIGCGGVSANPPATPDLGPPNPAACGIKIDASTCPGGSGNVCTGGSGEMRGGGPNITWESVEWKGAGCTANGNAGEPYFYWQDPTTNSLVTHVYGHYMGTTYITNASGGWNNGTVSYNYFWCTQDSSANHAEALQDTGSDSGTVIHHNVFRDQVTNGDLVFVAPVTGTHDGFKFYDNVDFCSVQTGGACRHNDGIIACINSQETCTNMLVYHNTFVNILGTNAGFKSNNAGSYTVEDNLWFNCAGINMGFTGTVTEDYNSFLNSGSGLSGAHDVTNTSSPNPFANWNGTTLTGLATLASDNANWNNFLALGAPYDIDAAGNTFTTNRGAYQFGGLVSPQPPTGLSATVI